MTKNELLIKLAEREKDDDAREAHIEADQAILDYLNDPEISEAYNKIGKWYA